MQVTAINSAFTGTQRQQNNVPGGEKSARREFEEFLFASETPNVSEEELDAALDRALKRMGNLVGAELAESVVYDDGSVNLVRLAQIMSAAESPYTAPGRAGYANIPQVVNLVA